MLDSLCILMPVYDDWEAVRLLIPQIDAAVSELGLKAEVVLVNDASPSLPRVAAAGLRAIRRIEVLTLKRNVGHQRALAVGLVHVWRSRKPRTVVVMDADGEDAPSGIGVLLRKLHAAGSQEAAFAERTKRAEGLAFRVSYGVFRMLHRALTGVEIRVGNFSILSPAGLERVVSAPELWNHYAAAVIRSKIPFVTAPIARAPRIAGSSKMHAVTLVRHGLSAISVFLDAVSVRMVLASGMAAGVTGVAALDVGGGFVSLFWGSVAWVVAALGFALLVLAGRSGAEFDPVRDCPSLISDVAVQQAVSLELQ